MAVLEGLGSGRVYLDANVFIYAVEAVAEYAVAIETLFGRLEEGSIVAVTSELTLAEVLTKPFEARNLDIARIYEDMLMPSAWLSVLPVERAILIEAARLQSEIRAPSPRCDPCRDGGCCRMYRSPLERPTAARASHNQAAPVEISWCPAKRPHKDRARPGVAIRAQSAIVARISS